MRLERRPAAEAGPPQAEADGLPELRLLRERRALPPLGGPPPREAGLVRSEAASATRVLLRAELRL
jgi:hypothetical protein